MTTLKQYNLSDSNSRSVNIHHFQKFVELHQSFNKRGWKITDIEFYGLRGADFESNTLEIKTLSLFVNRLNIVRVSAIKHNKKANCDSYSTFGADEFSTDFEDYTLVKESTHYYNDEGKIQF